MSASPNPIELWRPSTITEAIEAGSPYVWRIEISPKKFKRLQKKKPLWRVYEDYDEAVAEAEASLASYRSGLLRDARALIGMYDGIRQVAKRCICE